MRYSISIMIKYKKVEQKRAFIQIIDQLKSLISSGALKPGDRLPSERQFSGELGVNRHTVREALKILEYMGVVEGKTGIGTVVNNLGQDILIDQISHAAEFSPSILLSELMELRFLLEPGIAALAAERATKRDISIMRQAMNDLKKEFEMNNLGTDADERLHVALANATQNSTIIRITKPILSMLAQYREKSLRFKNRRIETCKEHERIYLAVKNRKPGEARTAMEFHLYNVQSVLK